MIYNLSSYNKIRKIPVIFSAFRFKLYEFCVPKVSGRPWAGSGCADRAKGPGVAMES